MLKSPCFAEHHAWWLFFCAPTLQLLTASDSNLVIFAMHDAYTHTYCLHIHTEHMGSKGTLYSLYFESREKEAVHSSRFF